MSGHKSLLGYLKDNQPDHERRAHHKSMGINTSKIDLDVESVGTGNMVMTVPPPPRSQIVTAAGPDAKDWLAKIRGNEIAESTSADTFARTRAMHPSEQSLVAPLLWVPGVLRGQGAWTSAMKETLHGPAFVVQPGQDLINSDLVSDKKVVTVEEEMMAKDQLIQELERALNKQRLVNDQLLQKAKVHTSKFSTALEKSRAEEHAAQERNRLETVALLEDHLQNLRDEMRTMRKASKSRVRRAYAQDNFLSQYAKAYSRVREQAQQIADVENMTLRNKVGQLERRMQRDSKYKQALKQRTEIAEMAAEKRWSEAERKIPMLESQITQSFTRTTHERLLNQERAHRHKSELERINAQLRNEQEARAKAEAHAQLLGKQLASSMRAGSSTKGALRAN